METAHRKSTLQKYQYQSTKRASSVMRKANIDVEIGEIILSANLRVKIINVLMGKDSILYSVST